MMIALWALAQMPAIVHAGSYSRLQILLPGEQPAPGTTSGKTGSPLTQTTGVAFTITVRACDSGWNTVGTVTDAIRILSSDASATLPATAQLVGGQGTFQVRFNAAGQFTVFAHDQTDNTIPDGTSSQVTALALQSFTFSTITQKNQTAGVPMSVTLTALDPTGHTVSGYNGEVRLKEITSYGEGRISPDRVTLSNGTWSGLVIMYRADETSINRGNVNVFAYLENAPEKNGTSDPFTVHPGSFVRLQVTVPGETPLPGSVLGKTGTPVTQTAGRSFWANVWATDLYWNPVGSGDNVRITSSDATMSPNSGTMSGGYRQFTVTLNTTGTQTLTVNDASNPSIQSNTSPPITVVPSTAHHFVVAPIASPQTAGVPVSVTIRATDQNNNTIPNYAGDAVLVPNTGAGSVTPSLVTFANGVWAGTMVFKGAGGAVSFTCADFASPPHTGTSNAIVVDPGPVAGMQVLLPGETARGGTDDGKDGTPTSQQAGGAFTLTLRAVDSYWNMVPTVNDSAALGSTDEFAGIPAHVKLTSGQALITCRLYRSGPQYIWASDLTQPTLRADTSSAVTVVGGPFARVLILAPGESPAPGTTTGRTGVATDQSINYSFTMTVLATDAWFNPVGGVSDVVHISCDDPLATLPADKPMVNGRAEFPMRLARGGYNQITVSDVMRPSIPGSGTQVRAITSGFHLEASVTPETARAGEPFTLVVRVTNDAGSVIQEINSFVTLEVLNASSHAPGQGTLLTTQFQLLQGQRSLSETYTFVEPVVIVAHDDAGNAPATSNTIAIVPGPPAAIRIASTPSWVGGNKRASVSARLVDEYENGIPDQPMTFSLLSGNGTLTPVDNVTSSSGVALADFLSARQPEMDRIRASSNGLEADLDLQTAFVDPAAPGGHVTNYPNPFHPPLEPTTIAYKLEDNAAVTLRIFTQSGDLVLRRLYGRGDDGGRAGLNEVLWDGRNGGGQVVASGGYVALIEAQGQGSTMHVIRRKIAVVR